MATLLAAGAASAAGYVIGSLASKPHKSKKQQRKMVVPPPPRFPLFQQVPHSPYMAPRPMMSGPVRAPLPPFPTLMRHTIPPPPPLPPVAHSKPLVGGSKQARPVKHTDRESCPVCKHKYESGDVIARMWCEHMVHKACLESFINSDVTEDMKCTCPGCGSHSYITRFAIAENPRKESTQTLPGLMPVPEIVMPMQKAWDPACVSPVFFGRYEPQPAPAKGIVITDDLSPLPAVATCTSGDCTPFFYNLRGGGPSCSLCDCAQCKRGKNCVSCGKCKCSNCKGVDCECACQCTPDDSSSSVSAMSFSDADSAVTSFDASYNASSAPNSSAMFSTITPSMFNRFAYQ